MFKEDDLERFVISKKIYDDSPGMKVLNENHPIFENTNLKTGDVFGKNIKLSRVELDGAWMKDDCINIDWERTISTPENINILATTYASHNALKSSIRCVGII